MTDREALALYCRVWGDVWGETVPADDAPLTLHQRAIATEVREMLAAADHNAAYEVVAGWMNAPRVRQRVENRVEDRIFRRVGELVLHHVTVLVWDSRRRYCARRS